MLLTSINFVNMTSWCEGSLFSLDETQEQHIGHCERARRMLGRAFALLLASQWGVFLTEAYFVYTYIRAVNGRPHMHACLSIN